MAILFLDLSKGRNGDPECDMCLNTTHRFNALIQYIVVFESGILVWLNVDILAEEGANDLGVHSRPVSIQLLRNYATIRDCMNRLMREEHVEWSGVREAENNNKQGAQKTAPRRK